MGNDGSSISGDVKTKSQDFLGSAAWILRILSLVNTKSLDYPFIAYSHSSVCFLGILLVVLF